MADSGPRWPPRSPHEAMLGTPGGRQRYRAMMNKTSPSPSPRRHTRALSAATASPGAGLGIHLPGDDDDDDDEGEEDEDEETLQLKLQEIQARLKLKKLQNAKAKEKLATQAGTEAKASSDPVMTSPTRRPRARTPDANENTRATSANEIQIPASPVRKLQFLQQQTSPSRVLLGIDKGLKAKDVSLKRAPSLRGQQSASASQRGSRLSQPRSAIATASSSEQPRPMTFNERLASARTAEVERAERSQRIQRARTRAFTIGEDEIEQYKKKAVDIATEQLAPPIFSREEVLAKSAPSSSTSKLPQSKTAPKIHASHSSDWPSSSSRSVATSGTSATSVDDKIEEVSFEAYSCMHLTKRILPHNVVARHISGKKVFNIKDVLRDVKAPDFVLPDVEQDIVVFGVVGRKSEPRSHQPSANKKDESRGKYLVVTLTDLEFELDLFLFDSGFSRYWKLTQGTVVAILNPNVMPPPPGKQDAGRFSLVINSGEDTILEIGNARDLGFCQSVKKDGDVCGAWVNKRKTHFCEFHSNEAIRKQRSTRLEVNSTGFGGQERQHKFSSGQGGMGKRKGNSHFDWETRSQWFASRAHSAADLIDGKDVTAADKKERAEFVQRNLEAKEKERELMKKLGKIGNGAGREYMEHMELEVSRANAREKDVTSDQAAATSARAREPTAHDMLSMGLLSKDRTIHLSPVKRKRPDGSQAGSAVGSTKSSASTAGFGWGANLKDKLSKMKEGENLHKAGVTPVRKKTRFVTEKGIREAGRESLGKDFTERQASLRDDDDDEELIIV